MKIAIDVSQVVYGTGVSVYTRNLVQNLLLTDSENSYLLFGSALRRKAELEIFFRHLKGDFNKKTFPLPPTLTHLVWNKLRPFSLEKLLGTIDILHSSDWCEPPAKAFKVTTVHDLVPLRFPKLSHPKIISVQKARLNLVKKECDAVIAPSEATKSDLVEMGFADSKIWVIPEAQNEIFRPAGTKEVARIKNKYRIHGNYLLAVGATPRKNIERIFKAYEAVKMHENAYWVKNLSLVVVGQSFISLDIARGIKMLGYVSETDMPALYSGAEMLVYPSLYEGFGIPLLEAFACETPVVTSNVSSLAEVAGDASELVDPYSVDSIAEGKSF